MKLCKNCVLPETFPGIKFNEEGICNYCSAFKGGKDLKEKKLRYCEKFKKLLKQYRGQGSYDALLSYSGGKDSTYTLQLLREEYGLNVLAVTMDNGFLPEQVHGNIRLASEKLAVDHIFFKPRFDVMKKIIVECSEKEIYPSKALARASTICISCMAIIKFSMLRLALERRIPFIFFGWSPGQIPLASSIMKNNPPMLRVMQKAVYEPLHHIAGDAIKPFFLEERHFEDAHHFFPYNLSPLSFLGYQREEILKKIDLLGWRAAEGVDASSTNCLLNSFANMRHKELHGFHPYAFEMAKLVREGYLSRSAALEKLSQPEDPQTVELVKKKLGL